MPDDKNFGMLSRHKLLEEFIMDVIKRKIDKEADIYLKRFDDHRSPYNNTTLYQLDEDLVRPWRVAVGRAKAFEERRGDRSMLDELDLIKAHVESVARRRAEHRDEIKKAGRNRPRTSPSKRKQVVFTELPITVRQDFLRSFSVEFASGPANLLFYDDEKVRELRASYAYLFDWESQRSSAKWTRFPWDVAFGALCEIKSKALGPHKSISSHFYDVMVMHRSVCDMPLPLEAD